MDNPPLDMLKDRAMPELASAVRAAREDVLEKWRALVGELLPSADELTRKQVENSVPALLLQIADALEYAEDRPTDALVAAAPSHGAARFHQHFKFNEMLVEY